MKHNLRNLLGAAAAGVGLAVGTADAASLDLKVTSETSGVLGKTVTLGQYPGASMGWDSGIDSSYLQSPSPAIDMPITNSTVGFDLKQDWRNPGNTNDYELTISGRGLSSPVNGNLSVTAFDNSDGSFNGLSFVAKVFDANTNFVGAFGLEYYSTNNLFLNLTNIHLGVSYRVTVTPFTDATYPKPGITRIIPNGDGTVNLDTTNSVAGKHMTPEHCTNLFDSWTPLTNNSVFASSNATTISNLPAYFSKGFYRIKEE